MSCLCTEGQFGMQSKIIEYAHQINAGKSPRVESPFKKPQSWKSGTDCLFLDSDEATKEQLDFISRVKRIGRIDFSQLEVLSTHSDFYEFRTEEQIRSSHGRSWPCASAGSRSRPFPSEEQPGT